MTALLIFETPQTRWHLQMCNSLLHEL